ncbi:Concanavalin A-like lectin/glucanases superfamily [uncultured Caudovirales phage]|uniref:Concanavalin A-like lectin/glucanases superfamily n=1 Tax=uncultured Caudovirales phage TaxID=2100421 RepID=A0A6J7WGL4_9CAUD|nr:Concanavalin A-like lectin/glucanases superfamily [uncultured Caudovirales phage]
MANKIQLRRDTAANWTRINPVLADGEPGLDITNNKIKLGDGTTQWAGLPYLASPEHNRLVNGNKTLTLGTDGTVTVPGNIALPGGHTIGNNSTRLDLSATGGVVLVTDRGTVQFGVNLEAPGLPSHFHINKTGAFDLFLGDDSNYVKLPALSGLELQASEDGVGVAKWTLDALGKMTLPANGVITTTPGYTGTTFNITDATQGLPVVITTSVEHALYTGTKIRITGITTMTQLNDQDYYVTTPSSNTLALYTDPECTIPVDGTMYSPYFAPSNRQVTPANTQLDLNSDNPFGSSRASAVFDSGRFLTTPQSTDFNIGANDDFTIEWFAKYSSTDMQGYTGIVGTESGINGLHILSGSSFGIFQGYNYGAWIGGVFPSSYYGIVADQWYHFAFVRNAGAIRFYVNGVKCTSTQGDINGNTTEFICDATFTIGKAVNYVGHGTKISNLRFTKSAVYTGNFTAPTDDLTALPNTKLLMLFETDAADTSGSILVGGDGSAVAEYAGSDLTIALEALGNTDPGKVFIRSAGTQLAIDGLHDTIGIQNPGGSFPFNSSGQHTVLVDEFTAQTNIDITNIYNNLIVTTPSNGYTGNDAQNINLPQPTRAGVEITVINLTNGVTNISGWPGYPYAAIPSESVRLISVDLPGFGLAWWVTGSFSW